MQSLVNDKLTKKTLDALQRDYLRPENCPDLVAPMSNKQIWQQLKQDTKNRFFSLKNSRNIDFVFVCNVASLQQSCK